MFSRLRALLEEWEEECFSSKKREDFAKAFERISHRYRTETGSFLQTEEERKAYLFTRLPGTFSAIAHVLQEIKNRDPLFSPHSFLDMGAGPGTGMWASFAIFPELSSYTLLEKDHSFMKLGKILAERSGEPAFMKSLWKSGDLEKPVLTDPHDLVLFSYSLGELKEGVWPDLLQSCWKATQKALVIIEPGTPKGYNRLMKVRDLLVDWGAHLWAPCPHSFACPLEKGDWCHFSVRVSRSTAHRKLKSASLGYEDEKFSYLVFGKDPLASFEGRIIRNPIRRSGHVELSVCLPDGVKKIVHSKKEGDLYKKFKKLEWGDFY